MMDHGWWIMDDGFASDVPPSTFHHPRFSGAFVNGLRCFRRITLVWGGKLLYRKMCQNAATPSRQPIFFPSS